VIVGPTAVGKSALAIDLAVRMKTVIISADSRQFFKEMNIGTAKPSNEELALVQHYFINTHSVHEDYNAAQYGKDVLQELESIFNVYNNVILCGGSGLYVKAVCDGFDDIPDISPEIREELTRNYEENGLRWLQESMKEMDPLHFEKMDQQNPQRLMRALEVKIGTGLSIGSFQSKTSGSRPFNIVKIGLMVEREELYKRINDRMDKMIAEGLFDEARQLYPFKNQNALQTVGYQEIFGYFDGLYDKEEGIRLLKQNSRRYAKRQLTWFKKDKAVQWFHPNDAEGIMGYLDSMLKSNT
jgi:tRNA dimethylallyltransferase